MRIREEKIFLNFLIWERFFPRAAAMHRAKRLKIKGLRALPESAWDLLYVWSGIVVPSGELIVGSHRIERRNRFSH